MQDMVIKSSQILDQSYTEDRTKEKLAKVWVMYLIVIG